MDNRMKLFFNLVLLSFFFSGCAKTKDDNRKAEASRAGAILSAQAHFTIVMSGSMHGQLDPCG